MSRSCKMIFTLFVENVDWEKIYSENTDRIRYLVCQGELCPTTKRFHWQGYIQFFKAQRFAAFYKLTGHKCRMEVAKGTTLQNQEYCTKLKSSTGAVYEYGKPTSQGKRSDLIHIRDMIAGGDSMKQVAEEHFGDFVRYHRGFEKFKNMVDLEMSQGRRDLKVTLITGKTGSGKTSSVLDEHGDKNVYIVEFDSSTLWWDGYTGQDVILLDDYNNNIPIGRLLRILDTYKLRLQIKGSFTYARWTKVYITTNLRRNELHSNAKRELRAAMFRRIHEFKSLWSANADQGAPLPQEESVTRCLGNKDQTPCHFSKDSVETEYQINCLDLGDD